MRDSANSTLVSLNVSPACTGVSTDQLLLEKKDPLIDIEFDSGHLLFQGVNHMIQLCINYNPVHKTSEMRKTLDNVYRYNSQW